MPAIVCSHDYQIGECSVCPVEVLLKRALACLNYMKCQKIPSLGVRSYDVAAEIDKYFREQSEQ